RSSKTHGSFSRPSGNAGARPALRAERYRAGEQRFLHDDHPGRVDSWAGARGARLDLRAPRRIVERLECHRQRAAAEVSPDFDFETKFVGSVKRARYYWRRA